MVVSTHDYLIPLFIKLKCHSCQAASYYVNLHKRHFYTNEIRHVNWFAIFSKKHQDLCFKPNTFNELPCHKIIRLENEAIGIITFEDPFMYKEIQNKDAEKELNNYLKKNSYPREKWLKKPGYQR